MLEHAFGSVPTPHRLGETQDFFILSISSRSRASHRPLCPTTPKGPRGMGLPFPACFPARLANGRHPLLGPAVNDAVMTPFSQTGFGRSRFAGHFWSLVFRLSRAGGWKRPSTPDRIFSPPSSFSNPRRTHRFPAGPIAGRSPSPAIRGLLHRLASVPAKDPARPGSPASDPDDR